MLVGRMLREYPPRVVRRPTGENVNATTGCGERLENGSQRVAPTPARYATRDVTVASHSVVTQIEMVTRTVFELFSNGSKAVACPTGWLFVLVLECASVG